MFLLGIYLMGVDATDMTLKHAASFAFVGTILAAALLLWNFVFDLVSVARGLVPAVTLFPLLIYSIAALSVAIFLYVFGMAQK